ncbi:unnamed protein product [Chondrus crispus]|uniref:Uncharacterized protein n=1 Tax=Chondrus crispus TaxID=2769 RepID=R7Q6U5_CHOCR|nr:unnamed protein product [Chondrus crispus]CDF33759.1 unnamed protein product [Chondrus crispus]|eukprot:XP_005713577.1 unnamed protein product [Chondrus crispus]
MECGPLVSNRFVVLAVLSGAELAEVFCRTRTDISEKFKSYAPDLSLSEADIEKDDGVFVFVMAECIRWIADRYCHARRGFRELRLVLRWGVKVTASSLIPFHMWEASRAGGNS